MFRLVLASLAALATPASASAKDFTLEGYFQGITRAEGSFSAINGVKRAFAVRLKGSFNG